MFKFSFDFRLSENSMVDDKRPDYKDDRTETATYDEYVVYHTELK